MSYAIVFSSRTGNTRRLAEAVRAALPAGECLYFGPPDAAALAAGRLYIGFWTDKGSCDEALAAFLPQLAGHEVFLFGTAGFGADPAYFDAILGRVAALLPPSAAVLGRFMCQGRMPDAVRARYTYIYEGERRTQMLANFDMARTHPDAADLAALTAAVRALPPQAFDLRAAKPADAGALGALHCQAWRETYPGLLPAAMLQSLSPEKKRRPLCAGGLPGHAARLLRRRTGRVLRLRPLGGSAPARRKGRSSACMCSRRTSAAAWARRCCAPRWPPWPRAGWTASRCGCWTATKRPCSFTRVSASPPPARPRANRRCANAACGGKAKMTGRAFAGFPFGRTFAVVFRVGPKHKIYS